MSYWRKRERRHMKEREKSANKIARKLKANQQQVIDDIDSQINEFYGRYADKEGITMAEARKRAAKADIKKYESKAKKYVRWSKSKDENLRMRAFTKTANEEMRLYNMTMRVNRLELLKANIYLDLLSMASYEERVLYDFLLNTASKEYERQAGILGKSATIGHKKLESIVNSSFLTATWSDRIWNNQEALRLELNRLINNNIVQGRGARYQARELRKVFDVGVYESERLLRTEMARVETDVFMDIAERYNIEKYEWIAEPTACDECASLDGKQFRITQGEWGNNLVPLHPNCMCALALVYEE